MGLSLVNKALGDHMVGIALEPGFSTRELFEMPFGRPGSAFLKTAAKGGDVLSVLLDRLTAKGFPLRVSSQVDDAKVNTQGSTFWLRRRVRRNIKRYRKKESPMAIEQIRLPFDAIQTGLLIASHTERDQHTALQCQQGNLIQAFEGH
jgi:hypothetical protein